MRGRVSTHLWCTSGRPCRLNWSHKIHHHNKSLRLDADKLREAFHRLDKDDNNYLDLAEITEALRQLHEAGTIPTAARSEDIELIFRTMDVDHNGSCQWSIMCSCMRALCETMTVCLRRLRNKTIPERLRTALSPGMKLELSSPCKPFDVIPECSVSALSIIIPLMRPPSPASPP